MSICRRVNGIGLRRPIGDMSPSVHSFPRRISKAKAKRLAEFFRVPESKLKPRSPAS